jgi:hypothetical protein
VVVEDLLGAVTALSCFALAAGCGGRSERVTDSHADEASGGASAAGAPGSAASAGSDSVSGAGGAEPEPPPGPDRALDADEKSYCDATTGTFGVIQIVSSCALSPGMEEPDCLGAEDATTVTVLDLDAVAVVGVFSAATFEETIRYVEGNVELLGNGYTCDEIGELVFVSETRNRWMARTFAREADGFTGQSSFGWSECDVEVDVPGNGVDRVELYGLVVGEATLVGPFAFDGPNTEDRFVYAGPPPGSCMPRPRLIVAGFAADELLRIMVNL